MKRKQLKKKMYNSNKNIVYMKKNKASKEK